VEGLWFNSWRDYGLTLGGAMVSLVEGLWFNSWRGYGLTLGRAMV
jgi:hypothetical protein